VGCCYAAFVQLIIIMSMGRTTYKTRIYEFRFGGPPMITTLTHMIYVLLYHQFEICFVHPVISKLFPSPKE